MKWGVRRFQNPDGSLTAAGKGRYNGEAMPKSQLGKMSTFRIKRQLNRTDKKMAKYKSKVAVAEEMKARARYKFSPIKQHRASKIIEKNTAKIKQGEEKTKRLLDLAKANNYEVRTLNTVRYTHAGRQVAAKLLAGSTGTEAMTYSELRRAGIYGPEAAGWIKGTKYNVKKKKE